MGHHPHPPRRHRGRPPEPEVRHGVLGTTFVRVGDESGYTRTTLLLHLPAPVGELLDHWVGYLGGGMIRTVDPANIARQVSALASPIHAAHAFPLLTSAFGDVVTHWQARLYLINARVGRYIGLGRVSRLEEIMGALTDADQREFLLGPAPWAQAVAAYGVPTPGECFAYVPPLAVLPRGPGDLTGVRRVGLADHLDFLGAFYGPAQGRL